jgi:hypothetical protein
MEIRAPASLIILAASQALTPNRVGSQQKFSGNCSIIVNQAGDAGDEDRAEKPSRDYL